MYLLDLRRVCIVVTRTVPCQTPTPSSCSVFPLRCRIVNAVQRNYIFQVRYSHVVARPWKTHWNPRMYGVIYIFFVFVFVFADGVCVLLRVCSSRGLNGAKPPHIYL